MRLPRMTTQRWMVVVAVLAAVLALVIMPLIREIERRNRQREYDRAAGAVGSAIYALKNRVPRGVHPTRWEDAVRVTSDVCYNALHHRHPPPIGELYRLRDELIPKFHGAVDFETLAWTWDRLARTGVDGRVIADELKPEFQMARKYGHTARHLGLLIEPDPPLPEP